MKSPMCEPCKRSVVGVRKFAHRLTARLPLGEVECFEVERRHRRNVNPTFRLRQLRKVRWWRVCPAHEGERSRESTYQSVQVVIAGHKGFSEASNVEPVLDKLIDNPPSECLRGGCSLLVRTPSDIHRANDAAG